ncbi:hypothetical protein [Mycolicibacterium sp.]|uniref:hypothetical protein n=1 Tax=Mycolicibacterium sp. TaxID=2320850 RepID=UPI003D0B41B3
MRRRTRAQANAAYIARQRRLNAAQRTKLHRESKQPTPNHQPPTPKPPRTPDHDNDPPPF